MTHEEQQEQAYNDRQAEIDFSTLRFQQECWNIWINVFLLNGTPVEVARQKVVAIIEEKTGTKCRVGFLKEHNDYLF